MVGKGGGRPLKVSSANIGGRGKKEKKGERRKENTEGTTTTTTTTTVREDGSQIVRIFIG